LEPASGGFPVAGVADSEEHPEYRTQVAIPASRKGKYRIMIIDTVFGYGNRNPA